MDQTLPLLALIGAAMLGIVATVGILLRDRERAREARRENPFATSTEGMKRSQPVGSPTS